MRRASENLILVLTLGSLHLVILQSPVTLVGKAVMLVHFGAVLLWQPLVSGGHRLSWREALSMAVVVLTVGGLLSWGVLLLWALMLAAVLGGRLFQHAQASARVPYWLALVCVVIEMLGLVLPRLLDGVASVPTVLPDFAALAVLPLYGLIAVLPARAQAMDDEARTPDLVGSMVIVLVLTGVVLGALVLMYLRHLDYLTALMTALAMMAASLLLLAWIWSPRWGFAGLGLEVSRRVLSGGLGYMPFDRWIEAVADLALREPSPQAFADSALARLHDWPGVVGLSWCAGARPAEADLVPAWGVRAAQAYSFSHASLSVELYCHELLAGTTLWRIDLMLRIVAEFHSAKLQAQQMQADSYLRAVHETGARVTHEIKNLLQSLHGLCFALQAPAQPGGQGAQALLERQLPVIVQRLEAALTRIRRPAAESLRDTPVLHWWQTLQARYAEPAITWQTIGEPGAQGNLPAALFDCVAENLLSNALDKAPGVSVQVSLRCSPHEGVSLEVTDSGAAIEAQRAENLFLAPQPSDRGLGIGLYQAGRFAESAGWRLELTDNLAGCVRFRLAQAPAA